MYGSAKLYSGPMQQITQTNQLTESGKNNVQTVFGSVYNFKMDHTLRRDARENVQEAAQD